jgi:hypothetical protein
MNLGQIHFLSTFENRNQGRFFTIANGDTNEVFCGKDLEFDGNTVKFRDRNQDFAEVTMPAQNAQFPH